MNVFTKPLHAVGFFPSDQRPRKRPVDVLENGEPPSEWHALAWTLAIWAVLMAVGIGALCVAGFAPQVF